ncbi:MAG: diaminopropionate ammonia-lyase [Coriobacteriales bacterium]|jgi:diaminopropionate ammonia-lyase|nr:diaminopropionate ammonia-lyase [Coriobacteriales bacterium]
MRDAIKWTANTRSAASSAASGASLALLNSAEVTKARAFHASIPGYEPTPLAPLNALAARLGIKGLYVKDESYRFGLNAFKVLGGSYAVGTYIAQRLGKDISELSFEEITSPETKAQVGDITFYTATDGNHGRGVAWAANRLGQKSVVCMPKGSSSVRLENIRKEGAEAWITDMNYDDAVRYVNSLAQKDPQGVMVQDTAWEGYEEIPSWIMQGYATMAVEADEQLKAFGEKRPTHVFVQAGVGSLAGAVQGYFANAYGADCPVTTIVEAAAADCLYRSALAGELVAVGGDLATVMAGLACGEGCTISWNILKDKASFFASCPDWVSGRGMRVLAAPLRGDEPVLSGESGAVGAGLVSTIMLDDEYAELRETLGLNNESVVLCFSTEGNTDPERYLSMVWDGFCPSYREV